jgi:peptidoglycan-associated lipoprotein
VGVQKKEKRMKRNGLIIFLVALLILPVMAITFTSCSEKVTIDQDALDAAEKAKLEKVRLANEKAEQDRLLKEQQLKDAAYAARSLFVNQYVYFDYDKYDITGSGMIVLRSKAEYMKNNPGITIEIQGHCDERGSTDYNLALGDRRAYAVAKQLESLGVSKSRMETISYGEEKPLEIDHSEDAWAMNRRAQIVITSGN